MSIMVGDNNSNKKEKPVKAPSKPKESSKKKGAK